MGLCNWLKTRRKLSWPDEITNIKKIALVVGHTHSQQGATAYNGQSEYEYNSILAISIHRHLVFTFRMNSDDVKVFKRDGLGRSGVAKEVAEWGADISLELHFNAYHKPAYGGEMLLINGQPKEIALNIIRSFSTTFQIPLRHHDGIKELKSSGRGYQNLYYMKKYGVKYPMLIEPCFATFETNESKKIIEGYPKYAEFLSAELYKVLAV